MEPPAAFNDIDLDMFLLAMGEVQRRKDVHGKIKKEGVVSKKRGYI